LTRASKPLHALLRTDSPGRFSAAGPLPLEDMDRDARLKRLRFRAWHRGTREADYLIGGFFDAYGASWGDAEMAWFEALLDEQDVDIMSWAIGTAPPPVRYEGEALRQLQQLDYIKHPE
jgi:antitoxin CptB